MPSAIDDNNWTHCIKLGFKIPGTRLWATDGILSPEYCREKVPFSRFRPMAKEHKLKPHLVVACFFKRLGAADSVNTDYVNTD